MMGAAGVGTLLTGAAIRASLPSFAVQPIAGLTTTTMSMAPLSANVGVDGFAASAELAGEGTALVEAAPVLAGEATGVVMTTAPAVAAPVAAAAAPAATATALTLAETLESLVESLSGLLIISVAPPNA